MTTFTNYTINNNGIAQIANFLRETHKNGAVIAESPDMLGAWATDAEFQLGEGNPAMIEVRSFDAVSGQTTTFTISDEGIDATEVTDEE